MKRLVFLLIMMASLKAFAGDSTDLYHPNANVEKDVAAALVKARKEHKNVLLQIGGNWCIWCHRFYTFVETDTTLKRLLDRNYIVYHLNYSKENKNLDYLKKLGFPQRFGFPVLVVLDAEGNRIHTQDSGLLEKGNGYDKSKVEGFLNNWSPAALNEAVYRE